MQTHAAYTPTYQSSALPTIPVENSARDTHSTSAVSIPTLPQRKQKEDTSHTSVTAEALYGRRHCPTHDLCYPVFPHYQFPRSILPPTSHISLYIGSFFTPPLSLKMLV